MTRPRWARQRQWLDDSVRAAAGNREFLAEPGQQRRLLARAIAFRVIALARLWPDAPDRVAAEIAGYGPVLALLGVSSLT
jgi:hypothetical protein